MKITNTLGLPDPIVNAVKASRAAYSKQGAEFSVTELIGPARQAGLRGKHRDEIVEDVSDMLYSLLGSAMHTILEAGAGEGDVVELIMRVKWMGRTIKGQFDLWADGTLTDYKTAKVYKVMKIQHEGFPEEWLWQQNIYRVMASEQGRRVKRMTIPVFLKDWTPSMAAADVDTWVVMKEGNKKASKAGFKSPEAAAAWVTDVNKTAGVFNVEHRAPKGYPQTPIVMLEVPHIDDEEVRAYVKKRIREHDKAHKPHYLPACSEEETWEGRRCEHYCNVNPFCTQYQKTLEGDTELPGDEAGEVAA